MKDAATARYRPVQGLARGLELLKALNRMAGGRSTINALTEATGLHRTTVRRLLETLLDLGYVRRSESDGSYGVSHHVRDLSEGFTDQEWISAVATPVMGRLLRTVQWPSDLTTLDGSSMLIRESTHRFSPLSFERGMVGRRMPLMFSASGRAYLAACEQTELRELVKLMIADGGVQGSSAGDAALLRNTLHSVRQRGYASSEGDWRPGSPAGALALPILQGTKVLGCINLVYRRRAMSTAQAAEQFLAPLKEAVAEIETQLMEQSHDATRQLAPSTRTAP
jgi:IclR family mhp operon transcriptional activator